MTHLFTLILLGTCTFILSLLVNTFLLRYSGKRFAKDAPANSTRWETKQKPVMGGISFFIGFMVALIAFFLFAHTPVIHTWQICAVILCISTAFVLGLYDDLHNASVIAKFGFQILIALILICSDIYIKCTPHIVLNYILTILWVVGIINSLNMLDNMDGVTGMTSLCIMGGLLTIGTLYGHMDILHSYLLVGMAFAVIGFLFFNFHPSKMYMGDIGSLTLGCTLAIFSILYLWNPSLYFSDNGGSLKMILCLILVFIIPLTDTATVFIKRISKGKSPFVGDKGHTTHHLVYAGFPQRWVCVLYAGITVISIAITACIIHNSSPYTCIIGIIYCMAVFGILFGLALTHLDKE